MKKPILTEICAALLLLLFAYTATSKFLDYDLFVLQMQRAPLPIMQVAAPILGWIVPLIEMIIVIALLLPNFRIKGIYSSVMLLAVFEFYIFGMLLSGQHLPCTCGGIISTMSWKQHLGFNALFILIGLAAIMQNKKYKSSSPIQTKTGKENIKGLSRA